MYITRCYLPCHYQRPQNHITFITEILNQSKCNDIMYFDHVILEREKKCYIYILDKKVVKMQKKRENNYKIISDR